MIKPQRVKKLASWLNLFGDRFYLELQRTGRANDTTCVAQSLLLAHQYQVPVVATNDVMFLAADDFEAHEARVCINQSRVLDDSRRPRDYSPEQYLRRPSRDGAAVC